MLTIKVSVPKEVSGDTWYLCMLSKKQKQITAFYNSFLLEHGYPRLEDVALLWR